MVEPNSFSDAYPICSFPTVELHEMQMTGILVKQFGLTAFRDWQLEIIQAVLVRKNTFVLQPTGSGKSLCFQFPPLVTKKMTVVLTPTIALMNNQTVAMIEKGIRATYLGSTQKDPKVEEKIATGQFDLVYVTPEKFFDIAGGLRRFFHDLISVGSVGLIAIEAHLISYWKSFRWV